MAEEANLEFGFKNVDERRNYLIEKINHNDLMSKKYKKRCKHLDYVQHLLLLVSDSYWLSFNFSICIIILCFTKYYLFFSRKKNLYNHCRNEKGVNYREKKEETRSNRVVRET